MANVTTWCEDWGPETHTFNRFPNHHRALIYQTHIFREGNPLCWGIVYIDCREGKDTVMPLPWNWELICGG